MNIAGSEWFAVHGEVIITHRKTLRLHSAASCPAHVSPCSVPYASLHAVESLSSVAQPAVATMPRGKSGAHPGPVKSGPHSDGAVIASTARLFGRSTHTSTRVPYYERAWYARCVLVVLLLTYLFNQAVRARLCF